MATVTPNFNWPVPTSTDLVKDGATAIEALGDSIDASLVDLKGGTTGQVLSKTSNTDMDFTWVAADDTNAIQNTIVDAKGDLIAASAADTPARLAVGNNGESLVADSSTSTGLRWQGSYPAGKNVLINGLLDIWQRSTSVTFSGEAYNAQDRWANYVTASSTYAQETSTIPTGCRYSCKVTVGASSAQVQSTQVIETANAAPYAGQSMTFSGYFQSSATPTIYFVVYYSNSVDVAIGGTWTTITATSGGSGTAGSSSFTRISGVYAIPSTAKSLKVVWYSSSMASASILYWGGMQFEAGSVPTQLTRNAGTIQGELAAAMRYYYLWTSGQDKGTALGFYQSSTSYYLAVPFPVEMRIKPTVVAASGTSYYYALGAGGYDTFNSVTAWQGDSKSMGLSNTTEVSGTAGYAAILGGGSASTSIAFSAEL